MDIANSGVELSLRKQKIPSKMYKEETEKKVK